MTDLADNVIDLRPVEDDEPITITKPGVYDGLHPDVYHADPVPAGSLSSTGARHLLPPSCPAKWKWESEHREPKHEFDVGHAAHKLVLGDEFTDVLVLDADNRRRKATQEAEAEARSAGKVPLLRKEWQVVEDMAAKLWKHPRARQLLNPEGGKPEQSIFWQDDRHGVWRRCRVDWLRHQRNGRLIIVDYKTADSAEQSAFVRSAINFGYHQQDDWYKAGVVAAGLDDAPAFLFVVQEKTPPYLVNVIELDPNLTMIGAHLNDEAIKLWQECRAADLWPGYSDGIELVSAPAWYEKRYESIIGWQSSTR